MENSILIRFFDILLSFLILTIFSPLIIFIFILCLIETGKPIFIQLRVGKNQKPFKLIKFRTMKIDTPSLASHLINQNSVTKFGKILRSLKMDELPQIYNVLNGEMSLVGPRPCLYNQTELIKLRKKYKLFNVKPGITGLSQINGIDMSDPEILSKTDSIMISKMNTLYYFKYLFLTLFGKGLGDKVK